MRLPGKIFVSKKISSTQLQDTHFGKMGKLKWSTVDLAPRKIKWRNLSARQNLGEILEGALKVSFFGPFYAPYNVIAIDDDYHYALVAGKNLKYLWLLSRDKTMPGNIKQQYLQKARAAGYNTSQLVWPSHD